MNENLVIEALKQSAIALEKQDKQSAINNLTKITDDVFAFRQAAATSEIETRQLQSTTTAEVSELIRKQGKAHAEHGQAKKELDATYSDIAVLKVAMQNSNGAINDLNKQLGEANRVLQGHEARMRDLNDTSWLSILISIGSLGFDRLVKAISIEIDGVRDHIRNINNTMGRFRKEVEDLKKTLAECDNKVSGLNNVVEQKNKTLKELSFLEFKLHNQEEMLRKRLVYFTEVNMFYIRLQNVLKNVSNKITDVRDIVNELDNQTPTIASFDPAQTELISLKQAILSFGDALKGKVSLTSIEPVFDHNGVYFLTNEWLGKGKFLTVDRTDAAQNKLIMADSEGKGQLWVMRGVGNGLFRMMNRTYLDQKSLDIVGDRSIIETPGGGIIDTGISDGWDRIGKIGKRIIADLERIKPPVQYKDDITIGLAGNGNGSGQLWRIEPEFGYFRLTCLQTGDYKSLEVVNEAGNMKLRLTDSSPESAGQQWRFTKYN